MDPLSLTFGVAGIVGLAGLFSTCLDVIDRVESYKDFGIESQSIFSQFEADKLLFQRWAQKVGISDRGLEDNHHKDLNDPETVLIVEKLFMSIHEIFSVTETTFLNLNQSLQVDSHVSQGRSQQYKIQSASKRSKLSWALKGKAKFITQVQQFGVLVQRLQSLVPLDGSKAAFHVNKSEPDNDIHLSKDEFLKKPMWLSDFQRILMEVEKQIESDTRKELDHWLNASRTNALYDDFIRKRLDGTCNWILNRPVFIDWTSSEFPLGTAKMLWINGPPGYGKTILCARLVHHLSTTLPYPVAYYFFSSDSENRGDPFDIIRSWISQVISINQDAFELTCLRWDTKAGQSASRTDIIELFQEIAKRIPKCIFVVDGLDECAWTTEGWRSNDDSPIGFLSIIKQAIARTATRILIVSRDEVGIRSGFHATLDNEPITLSEFKISPEDVQSDAISFSRSVVDNKLANKNEVLRHNLSRRIVDRCEGMFLWVKMLENQLRGGKNRKQLEDIVDETPTALEHLYDRNWMGVSCLPNKDRDRAFSILRWTAFSLRPLTILELTTALLIVDNDDCDCLLVDQFPDDIDEEYVNTEILNLCGSLLETRSGSSANDICSMTVQPVHFSVKQYILCNISVPGMLNTNERLRSSNETLQNNFLAGLCLRYINFDKVWQEPGQQDAKVIIQAFRGYAASTWYQHFHQGDFDYRVVKLINTLFHPENKNWEYWRRWFDNTEQGTELPSDMSNFSPLYYTSLLGLKDTVVFLVDGLKLDLNYRDGFNRTALLGACSRNRISVVRLLLEKGADVTVANQNGCTPLYSASNNGHVEIVKLLLEKGADVTVATQNGWTPLSAASDSGHVDVVKLLLEKGADLTVATQNGWTPLNAASGNGHVDVVKLLLEKGADVTVATQIGWTPLNAASDSGHVGVVKLLLEKGADVTVATQDGWTPLNTASNNGHIDVVKLLLEKGADVTVATQDGWTPLNTASNNGHIDVIKLLLEKGADVTVANQNRWTPLNTASNNGHVDVVKLLLEKGADVAVATQNGLTPLNTASNNGHVDVVKLLLEKGADVMASNKDGCTPLEFASSNGHIDVVKLLLEKGADVTVSNKDGCMPLEFASGNGHIDVVKLLLEKGADVTITNKDGWTPLNAASDSGHVDVVKLLLEKEADVTVATQNGWTPLSAASDSGHVDVVKLLLEKGADLTVATQNGWTPLNAASSNGHFDVVKLLLEKGADVTVANQNGWTPLSLASRKGHVDVAKLLLEKGADVTVSNKNGCTPLEFASSNGHIDVVKLLLEKGADVTVSNKDGCMPLEFASGNGHIDVVKLLLEKGADVTITNKDEWTPLNAASDSGHVDVVKLLLEKGADVTVANQNGCTPLYSASNNGHVEIVKLLLEKGADVTVATQNGWTPLSAASDSGHVDVVKLLLEKGADLTVATQNGWTPLNTASRKGHVDVVKLLLEKGADVTAATPNGRMPLSWAAGEGYESVVRLLVENGAEPESKDSMDRTPLWWACRHKNGPVKLLLDVDGIDVDSKDCYNSTALSIAARMGYRDVVSLLLTRSHGLNVKDNFGRTPLWWARRTGNLDIADLLIENYKENGIIVQEDDLPIAMTSSLADKGSRYCDVCILDISDRDTYYHCKVCSNGDFDICKEYFVIKAYCLDETHTLTKEMVQEAPSDA